MIALRPWRDCERTTEGCNKHVTGINSKFCCFTCKVLSCLLYSLAIAEFLMEIIYTGELS